MPNYRVTAIFEADNYEQARLMADSMYHELGRGIEVAPAGRASFRVNEFKVEPVMGWGVGFNMPGYLPECDVEMYERYDEALDALIDLLQRHYDQHQEVCECPTDGDTECRQFEKGIEYIEDGDATSVQVDKYIYWVARVPL